MRRLILVVILSLAVVAPFAVPRARAEEGASLQVKMDPGLGAYLTDGKGKTLYLFTKDTTAGQSSCYDQCAGAWPALAADAGMKLPEGVPGQLGTIERTDGTKQATYNDIPLYYFAKDDEAGDVYGQGVGGVWFVVPPGAVLGPYATAPGEGTPVPSPTLKIGFREDLGPFLIDADGRTVYLFTKDTKAGESACYDECAANWPAVAAADTMLLPPGIAGTLGSLKRTDGAAQLTYNDIPLYYFAKDDEPGDVYGQEVGDVWYVVTPGMKLGDEPHEGEEHAPSEAATPASS